MAPQVKSLSPAAPANSEQRSERIPKGASLSAEGRIERLDSPTKVETGRRIEQNLVGMGHCKIPHSIREIPTYVSGQCGRNRICKRERPNANAMIYRVCEGESTSVMTPSHHIRPAIDAAVQLANVEKKKNNDLLLCDGGCQQEGKGGRGGMHVLSYLPYPERQAPFVCLSTRKARGFVRLPAGLVCTCSPGRQAVQIGGRDGFLTF